MKTKGTESPFTDVLAQARHLLAFAVVESLAEGLRKGFHDPVTLKEVFPSGPIAISASDADLVLLADLCQADLGQIKRRLEACMEDTPENQVALPSAFENEVANRAMRIVRGTSTVTSATRGLASKFDQSPVVVKTLLERKVAAVGLSVLAARVRAHAQDSQVLYWSTVDESRETVQDLASEFAAVAEEYKKALTRVEPLVDALNNSRARKYFTDSSALGAILWGVNVQEVIDSGASRLASAADSLSDVTQGSSGNAIPSIRRKHLISDSARMVRFLMAQDEIYRGAGVRVRSCKKALDTARGDIRDLHELCDQFAAALNAIAHLDEAHARFAMAQMTRSPTTGSPAPVASLDTPFRLDRVENETETAVVKVAITIPSIEEVRSAAAGVSSDASVKAPSVQALNSAYASGIASLAVVALAQLAEHHADSEIVLNLWVDSVDPKNGHDHRVCLLSVVVESKEVSTWRLERLDAISCIRAIGATVSRAPGEKRPVKPLVDFDKTDKRFIDGHRLIESLDSRTNLLELNPTEFEQLIENLFGSMGLDTHLTRASRDGGVDCVAYDHRPVLGGKIVIQAKRYAKIVGVSAVRDLYGATHNEGATKGILVTTSHYGKGSYEFASGKPLELIDGSQLLYLLREHLHLDARIQVPESWIEPGEQ
ncbi:restriction endonuclease [Demequina sp. TTPB684]|uniref:restriction endonuclease n=1 Tax=unclassified Demequina TaxID=2620311 RepID=UPI001CF4591E|nr:MULTISPECIES: restriction endonuclease [unclassified Demequina]MCB2412604.1 restriction endonuclease [Demequina sp. TTPB684]UPU89529.1 restriction endonuclease [Demequina sp. TMPB413]